MYGVDAEKMAVDNFQLSSLTPARKKHWQTRACWASFVSRMFNVDGRLLSVVYNGSHATSKLSASIELLIFPS